MNETLTQNLIECAKWHKERCQDSECNVSLFMLGVTFAKIAGRDLTEEEQKIFI